MSFEYSRICIIAAIVNSEKNVCNVIMDDINSVFPLSCLARIYADGAVGIDENIINILNDKLLKPSIIPIKYMIIGNKINLQIEDIKMSNLTSLKPLMLNPTPTERSPIGSAAKLKI